MTQQPTLETQCLVLRPLTLADAKDVQRLGGDREVARTTLHVPYPYEDGLAEQWIATHKDHFRSGAGVNFAIVIREEQTLCGVIGLGISRQNNHAELGYWIGVPYWGRGYCTEAARAVVRYGFEELKLHRIHAAHFGSNPASGRIMQKLGMRHEGCLREHILKWERREDTVKYGLLAEEWKSAQIT